MPEGEVRVRLAVDVEAVRVGEHPCVAVRRRQPDQDDPLGRYLHSPTRAFVVASRASRGNGVR